MMKSMQVVRPGMPLTAIETPVPLAGVGQILVRVSACGVCRTDLHVADGDLTEGKLPIVPGHEIVGKVAGFGKGVDGFAIGQRIGVPWLGYTCGTCTYCRSQRENLCPQARFTGYHLDGGYAQFTWSTAASVSRFPMPIPIRPLLRCSAPD